MNLDVTMVVVKARGERVSPPTTIQRELMPAYAIAHLRTPQINDDVLEYLERIQATLDAFSGRFLVHGATPEVIEGSWPGTIVIIQFPDVTKARAWYDSPAYRDILPLRTNHIEGDAIIIEGVTPDYDPAATAAMLRDAREYGISRTWPRR